MILQEKKAHEQSASVMGYIDPMCFYIVHRYLSYFSKEPVNTQDILKEPLVDSIIEQDSYFKCLKNPRVLILESFDEVCDFIGSIPLDFFET